MEAHTEYGLHQSLGLQPDGIQRKRWKEGSFITSATYYFDLSPSHTMNCFSPVVLFYHAILPWNQLLKPPQTMN